MGMGSNVLLLLYGAICEFNKIELNACICFYGGELWMANLLVFISYLYRMLCNDRTRLFKSIVYFLTVFSSVV